MPVQRLVTEGVGSDGDLLAAQRRLGGRVRGHQMHGSRGLAGDVLASGSQFHLLGLRVRGALHVYRVDASDLNVNPVDREI